MTGRGRFPHRAVSLLGLLTIVGYGSWYYSFGVLLEPILDDTGWSERWLVSSFSATGLAGAFAAPLAGKLIDRQRFRPVLAVAGVLSGVGLFVATTTDSLAVFVVGTGVGGASLSAFAFYHVTQTLAVRYAPDASARSVGVLTLWGAFASTVYLPLTAFLIEAGDWRSAMRVLAVIVGVFLVVTSIVLPKPPLHDHADRPGRGLAFLNDPLVRRHAIASFAIGVSVGIVLVYQVTIMTAAGLSLTTAAWLAGARGTAQFVGRLPVIWLVERVGSARGLQLSYAAIGAGLVFLAFSGNPVIGFGYVLISGVGIGAVSPIQGIHAGAIFPPNRLGQGMGTITLVFGAAMALGPTAIAFVSDGSVRWLAPIVAIAAATVAVVTVGNPSPRAEAVSDPIAEA